MTRTKIYLVEVTTPDDAVFSDLFVEPPTADDIADAAAEEIWALRTRLAIASGEAALRIGQRIAALAEVRFALLAVECSDVPYGVPDGVERIRHEIRIADDSYGTVSVLALEAWQSAIRQPAFRWGENRLLNAWAGLPVYRNRLGLTSPRLTALFDNRTSRGLPAIAAAS